MTAEELIARLESDPLERLKWLVLSRFKLMPGSAAAKEASDEDFILCGAHMVLDGRQRSDVLDFEGGQNISFDGERFEILAEESL